MAEKRTKSDKAERQADQLEKKSDRRPAQNQKKKATREDVNQAAVRSVDRLRTESNLEAISMTNEERKDALLKLEQNYDLLCAHAKDLIYQMSREPAAASARSQFLKKLISIDQQRTNLYAEMDALWK